MNKIRFPLKLRMKGAKVGNLQAVLQILLDRGIMLQNDESARRELSAALQRELSKESYGNVTRKLVNIFQEERHFEISSTVDEPTAGALEKQERCRNQFAMYE